MAAALELVLREEVAPGALVHWLKHDPGRRSAEENHIHEKLVSLSLPQKDFVPFFLNFLREQTGQILTNGPSTPAKTPNSKALGNSAGRGSQRRGSERRAGNTTGSSSSRMQLFTQKGSANSCSPDTSFAPSAVSGGSPAFTGSNLSSPSSDFPSVVSSVSPSFGCSPVFNHSERRSAQKANLGNFFVAMPEVQPTRRGRRKGNSSTSTSSRQVARDLGRCLADEEDGKSDNTSWSGGRKKRNEVLGVSASSPPDQLNLNNLEEFPPMCASSGFTNKSKPSRRINPTPVSIERPLSKPKMCFTSTPVSQSPAARFPSGASHEAFVTIQEGNVASTAGSSLQEEREMLKKERCKLLHQASSPAGLSLEPSTPTKLSYTRSASLPPEGHLMTCAYLKNLVPNIFLELFFVLQLLTSRGISAEDGESDLEFNQGCKGAVERQHFHNVHNCVYFAVQVLDRQYELISHLEKGTLKLLAENERIASFSPHLHKRLRQAYESSTAKVSLLLPSSVQSVSFQPETDNRSNFPSDRAFHIFKKQRDIFYELLREWEDNHEKPAWDFERVLGNKIRAMMAHLTATCNHSHFARLFQKQIIQMCKGPVGGGTSWGDTPDQDVLNMLGCDDLSRLKRLQERFVAPQSIRGPCPPPSFPGCQQFFRDFILSAGSYQFNQHLMDNLCLKILELDGLTLVEHEPSDGEADMEEQDEKKHFTVVLMSLRLLAKFLGFLVFLPYRTVEPPTRDLHESAVALRNQSLPVLDVLKLLQRAIQGRRTILTIPWIVEFLSLVDHIAPFLDYYGTVFSLLLQVYRWAVLLTWYVCCGIGIPRPPGFGLHVGCLPVDLGVSEIQGSMVPSEDKEMSFLNKLLILAVLGWLFQFLFQIPSVPEELFFTSEVRQDGLMMDTMSSAQALDSATLVDQQLLYTCCPYLGELRKLLASFVAGSGAKNGGFIRKITPTAAESLAPKPSVTQQKLQAELEQAFFHNQPPSLRRTVEFVAERVGSNCVKHIKATLVAELVKRAEVMLQEKVKEDNTNHDKLLDEVCTQLYEEGAQAFLKGREFCRKKGPEAVRVLLPEETSAAVLSSAEDIAVRLATEKACTWLSTNITALIKREVRTTFSRMLKIQGPSLPSEDTQEMKKDCPPGCQHHAPFPSEIINEIKDVLCIAVGPRDGDEAIHYAHLECLLEKLSQTLQCRKFMCPTSEQQLAKCTIELASLLVSDRIPIQGLELQTQKYPERQRSKNHPICNLLTSLLSVWKEDFVMLVPVQLIFSKKNVGYVAEAKQREWDLFLFMLHGLVEYNLMGNAEIESYLQSLQEFAWPSDFLKELETLSRVFESELHIEELRTNPCELVRQSLGAVTAQS
ncbi:codanin-1 isoform X3 [Alligator mississippiensis]|uniref:codanin-1 isoform X3 n=1 Tax=Alligator mississippiensis TaxID=8496 RepID=UPI0009073DBC|nr:codanin-1 isoform X3 [Alligator mississippiensis]